MAKSLDEVLSGKTETEVKTEVTETPQVEVKTEVETKTDKPRDETGKFRKGEEVAATPTAKTKDTHEDSETGLKAGITAERKKRQEAERQAAEYRSKLEALQNPKKAPDVLEDPEGYRRTVNEDVEAKLEDQRVNMSAAMARKAHADFDEVMAEWPELMQADPSIYKKAATQELPAEWAYQYVKRERFLKEVGEDPDAWRKAEREKFRAELEPELRKQLESVTPTHVIPPPSLASASSGGRVSGDSIVTGPKPLSKIFGR